MEERSVKLPSCPEISRRLSLQRHDFFNHMQVVYGYIQIGKGDQALRYLDELTLRMQQEGKAADCVCPEKIQLRGDMSN